MQLALRDYQLAQQKNETLTKQPNGNLCPGIRNFKGQVKKNVKTKLFPHVHFGNKLLFLIFFFFEYVGLICAIHTNVSLSSISQCKLLF